MMILFLTSSLLALLALTYLQLRWLYKHADIYVFRIVFVWSILAIVALIIRFGFPFYKIEGERLRHMIMLLTTLALLWFVLLGVAEILICILQRRKKHAISAHRVLLFVLVLVLGLGAFGYWQAGCTTISVYSIRMKKKMKNNVNMALISDLHIGSGCDKAQIKELFDQLKAIQPDALVISGDLFDEATPSPLMRYFCEMSSTLNLRDGIFYAGGNHELLQKKQRTFEDMMRSSGIHVLHDEALLVQDSYYIVGRNDKKEERASLDDIMMKSDSQKPCIVVDHRPDVDENENGRIDLQLSGHTHHGQIFPNTLLTKIAYPRDYGRYDSPYTMIVTSGYGTWGIPIRIGSSKELVTVQITS